MTIARSRTFRSGKSEAVRLPKDVAFGDDVERVLVRSGDVITMYPAGMTIPAMLQRLQELPRPRAIERRDDEPLPERAGPGHRHIVVCEPRPRTSAADC